MSYGSRFDSIQLVYTQVTFVLHVHMVNVCGTHEGCEDGPENDITVYIFLAFYFFLGSSDVIVLLSQLFCINSIKGETVPRDLFILFYFVIAKNLLRRWNQMMICRQIVPPM